MRLLELLFVQMSIYTVSWVAMRLLNELLRREILGSAIDKRNKAVAHEVWRWGRDQLLSGINVVGPVKREAVVGWEVGGKKMRRVGIFSSIGEPMTMSLSKAWRFVRRNGVGTARTRQREKRKHGRLKVW